MSDKVPVVFTAKSIEHILSDGGTSSWRLDPNNARRCLYVVCTRNANDHRNVNANWVNGLEAHQSAFLVGKIKDVVPSPYYSSTNDRYLIQFSEYARVSIPEVWKGYRNPVKYVTLEEIGLDPSTLQWEPMPEPVAQPTPSSEVITPNAVTPLTMAEAKRGLALTFGVPPEAIEITIRG